MESEGVTRAWKEVMPDDHRGDWWLSVRVERHGTALAKCQGGEAAQPNARSGRNPVAATADRSQPWRHCVKRTRTSRGGSMTLGISNVCVPI